MSIELANDSKQLLGQVASNKGYSDLIAAADKQGKTPVNLPLILFFERGFTTAVTSETSPAGGQALAWSAATCSSA